MPTWIIGVDEVGRGALAGPVGVGVAAVSPKLDLKTLFPRLKDSKLLRPDIRREIHKEAERYRNEGLIKFSVILIDATVIDTKGIVYAIQRGIIEGLDKLNINPQEVRVLLDGGLKAPNQYFNQRTIIKGDLTTPCISLASVVAKVERDAYMEEIDGEDPRYGFIDHKGYGTVLHRKQIHTHGLSPLHRVSFCKNFTK